MSAPKIPEGPWKYEADTERVFGPRRELICWMKPSHRKPSRSEPDTAALNGKFIAAAPERIAALEAQVTAMRAALSKPVTFGEVLSYAEDASIEDDSTRMGCARARMAMDIIAARIAATEAT